MSIAINSKLLLISLASRKSAANSYGKNFLCRHLLHCSSLHANSLALDSYSWRSFSGTPHPWASKSDSDVRVRFAPSPTGYLHLGGLRTALYNYLLAKSSNGSFILRIEDTDSNRFVPGAAESLYNMLKWAQILPNEGYGIGGSRGPYVQSERRHLYQKYALELVELGSAYRCFCSPMRLEIVRKESHKTGYTAAYDNRCRWLTKAKSDELLSQGTPYCIRLKLAEVPPWQDTVYGSVYHAVQQEADPVILKTDGQATYHLANVVDDHLMGITHVVRGDEWLLSTPKHLLMYRMFDWRAPVYAHLPLLLNTDGSKLSKRQDNLRVEELRRAGHSARTLINLVLGSGFRGRDQDTIYSLDQLVDMFSLNCVTKQHATVDMDRLSSLSQADFIRSVSDAAEKSDTVQRLQSMVREQFGDGPAADSSYISRVLDAFLSRPVDRLSQLLDQDRAYLWASPQPLHLSEHQRLVVQATHDALVSVDASNFNKTQIREQLQAAQKLLQPPFKTAAFMQLLREVLCGTKQGEPVAEVLEILGRQESLRRLHNVL